MAFPDELKLVEIMSAYRKVDLFDKENYRRQVYNLMHQRYLNKYFLTKGMAT